MERFINYYLNYFLPNQKQFYLSRDDSIDIVNSGTGPNSWPTASVQTPNFSRDNHEIQWLLNNPCINGLTISWIVPYNSIISSRF